MQGTETAEYSSSESPATVLSIYDGRNLIAMLTVYQTTVYVTDADGKLRGPFGSKAAALQYVAAMAPA